LRPWKIPRPGSTEGPCRGKCRCAACVFLKRLSKELCRFCDQKIGYENPLFVEYEGVYVHWACVQEHFLGKKPMKEFKPGEWMSVENEAYREYIYPDGSRYRIDNPIKVLVKQKPDGGNSHRVVSKPGENHFRSHYVRPGWNAIEWEGFNKEECFNW